MKSSFLERCILFLLGAAVTVCWLLFFCRYCFTFAP